MKNLRLSIDNSNYNLEIDDNIFNQKLLHTLYVLYYQHNNIYFKKFDDISKLQETIDRLQVYERPLICTEYMAREFGSTFEFSMPIFKENKVGCFSWGLVAGKSQTHFGWSTILDLKKKKEMGDFLEDGEVIPEPEVWFHDILRADGTPFNEAEIRFIKDITS